MVTVCAGWKTAHAKPIVLKPEDGGEPGTSHGMCPDCASEMFPNEPGDPAHEYAAYLANPTFDPRD